MLINPEYELKDFETNKIKITELESVLVASHMVELNNGKIILYVLFVDFVVS